MKIYVKSYKKIELEVEPYDPIWHLKNLIYDLEGVDKDHQRFVF